MISRLQAKPARPVIQIKMSTVSANIRSDRHRPPPIATATDSADAPLRVYDRFAAAAIDTGLSPPTAASNSRNNRGSVFGAWSNSANGHTIASPTSPPILKDSKLPANGSAAGDDAKEEVLSISAVSAKGHRREESELTSTSYLSTSPASFKLPPTCFTIQLLEVYQSLRTRLDATKHPRCLVFPTEALWNLFPDENALP